MITTATPAAVSKGRFQPATRKKSKLRLAVDGPSGSGKTYTLLRFAFTLAPYVAAQIGRPARVAVIDTEHGSASLYQGESPDALPWEFDVQELKSFAPTDYTAAIEEAGRSGYDVLVIDSLSHAWEGKDGALELVSKKGGNQYTAWRDVTPMHRGMVEAILSSPMHVLCSMRSKVDYVLEKNEQGKEVPRKVGMAPIQRPGMEYEFTMYMSMDWSHIGTVTKSRCSAVDGAIVVKPGPLFLDPVIRWLDRGEEVTVSVPRRTFIDDAVVSRLVGKIAAAGRTVDDVKKETFKRFSVAELNQLTAGQAEDLEIRLDIRIKQVQAGAAATSSGNGSPAIAGATPEPSASTNSPAAVAASGELLKTIAGNTANGNAATVVNNTTFTEADHATTGRQPGAPIQDSTLDKAKLPNHDPIKINWLFEFLAGLAGWDQATKNASWEMILAKRGVKSLARMKKEQKLELGNKLDAKIRSIMAQRGEPVPEWLLPSNVEPATTAAPADPTPATPTPTPPPAA